MTAQILHWPRPAGQTPLVEAADPEITGMLTMPGSLLEVYDEDLLDTVLARLNAWETD